jgi:hypothetical protein
LSGLEETEELSASSCVLETLEFSFASVFNKSEKIVLLVWRLDVLGGETI